jgi:glucuronate isomerase
MNIKPFLSEHFFLDNKVGEILYHEFAENQPIIDYHSHIVPADIANSRRFKNITEIWLESDSTKWRAMRAFGVNEKYITGDATDYEKFQKWAETTPFTIRHPLYLWNHLELNRFFSIDELLSSQTSEKIYNEANIKLQSPDFNARNILDKMNVEVVATTDDPADSLLHHQKVKNENCNFKMIPTFRPDNAIHIEKPTYSSYIEKLSDAVKSSISSFDDLLIALQNRADYFQANGCKISDHGLEQCYSHKIDYEISNKALQKALNRKELSEYEILTYKSTLLFELGKIYANKQWVMQLHLGAMRNNNTRLEKLLGADTGFDSIGDLPQARQLSTFLDRLDSIDKLPKTIIYNLNPRDNDLIATMIGNFNDGTIKGKIQFGSGWWFNDQKDGIEKQLNALSNQGMLSCFVGMLSDSRSLLSYTRHEYFRRILCNLIGKDVHNGELPNDINLLGSIVKDICYNNAKSYFDF